MMADLTQKRLFDFLNEGILTCNEQRKKLLNDDRNDEATFEKIKANIYEIFQKMLSLAIRKSGENERAIRAFFLEKLEQIPATWTVSYEKAVMHGDTETMHIEKIKLDVVQEIKVACSSIWEEQDDGI